MSSNAGLSYTVLYAYSGGRLVSSYSSNGSGGVRPVVYLKSSVEIDSGTGTALDPYKLK